MNNQFRAMCLSIYATFSLRCIKWPKLSMNSAVSMKVNIVASGLYLGMSVSFVAIEVSLMDLTKAITLKN